MNTSTDAPGPVQATQAQATTNDILAELRIANEILLSLLTHFLRAQGVDTDRVQELRAALRQPPKDESAS